MHGIFFNPPIEQNYIGHILAEIYKDKVYDSYLRRKKDLTILDIGANIGLFSYYASQFAKQIYALEPAKEHREVFQFMLDYNKITNVKILPYALYFQEGEFDFFHNQNKTMFSLHMAVNDNSSPSEKVRAIRLDTLLKEQNIDHVDFMKLDVEGSEAEILGSESFSNVADKIDSLIVEVHSWNGRHPNQVREALKNNGFTVNQIPNDAMLLVATK